MTFLHPMLLAAGLAAVSIPILIHLLMRRRRKPVQWGAMRFLVEAYKKHKRRLTLEQWLLLAMRCLLIALVAIALARPLVGSAGVFGGTAPVNMYVLLDNSIASQLENEQGTTALATHKESAAALLEQLDSTRGDRAALLTLGGPPEAVVLPPSADIAAVGEALGRVQSCDSRMDLRAAAERLRNHLSRQEGASGQQNVVVVLSDFRAGSGDASESLAGLGGLEDLRVLAPRPSTAIAGNVSIVDVQPIRTFLVSQGTGSEQASATRQAQVRVTLRRSASASGAGAMSRVVVDASEDGRPRGRTDGSVQEAGLGTATVPWDPGQTEARTVVTVEIDGRSGERERVLTARIDADDLPGDNVRRESIEVRDAIRVVIVAPRRLSPTGVRQFNSADWIRVALTPSASGSSPAESLSTRADGIELRQVEPELMDAQRLAGVDCAIITRPDQLEDADWDRLADFARSGGLVMLVTPEEPSVHVWPDAMNRAMGLSWQVGREPIASPDGIAVEAPQGQSGATLLSMLSAELPELVSSVQVMRSLEVSGVDNSSEVVLAMSDGRPLILSGVPSDAESDGGPGSEGSRGRVVLVASALSLDWTDLSARPLMVPLFHELVRQGVGAARGTNGAMAGTWPTAPSRAVELRPSSSRDGLSIGIDPATRLPTRAMRETGVWNALDSAGATVGKVIIDPDVRGSRTEIQDEASVLAWLEQLGGAERVSWIEPRMLDADNGSGEASGVAQGATGSTRLGASLPLLLAALALAFAEAGFARIVSHARSPKEGGL